MAVASKYGIPRSQLLGREPEETTTYEYDENGRLLRSVTTREPRWTDEDIAWAAAWMQEQADCCPGECGLPLSETTAMKEGVPVHTYHVDIPRVCRACETLAKKKDAYAKQYEDPYPQAKVWEIEQVS